MLFFFNVLKSFFISLINLFFFFFVKTIRMWCKWRRVYCEKRIKVCRVRYIIRFMNFTKSLFFDTGENRQKQRESPILFQRLVRKLDSRLCRRGTKKDLLNSVVQPWGGGWGKRFQNRLNIARYHRYTVTQRPIFTIRNTSVVYIFSKLLFYYRRSGLFDRNRFLPISG